MKLLPSPTPTTPRFGTSVVKWYAAILGFIVGDALGVPYEFRSEKDFICKGMDGYKAHYQPPGTWSDDTSMLLATLNAKNLVQILDNYCDWYYLGAYTPFGVCFVAWSPNSVCRARCPANICRFVCNHCPQSRLRRVSPPPAVLSFSQSLWQTNFPAGLSATGTVGASRLCRTAWRR